MKKYNILVTGVGAIIGYGIIQSLKKSNLNLNIVAIDIYDDAYGKNIADTFYQGVLASSVDYVDFINEIVAKEKIDLIIPGIEQDLYSLFLNKEKINTKIVFNNELCINLSKDKWLTYNYLKENFKLNLIPTLFSKSYEECVAELGLPFLLKPKSSYASKGIHIINNKREFDFYSENQLENSIFQKIIGTMSSEYTVSVFGNGEGDFFDSIILKRELSGEGATSKATVVQREIIDVYVAELVKVLKPIGPTNIQIRMENNIPYLLEINPRISSACSLRTSFGYNEPEMCINYFLLNETISPSVKKMGSAVRFIDDFITYE
jgi:carbamoyl-phosphate synthase large subunit